MPDREEIAKRHGIPDQVDKLVGDTAEELEADAAARAALAQMVTPVEMDADPEPEPVEGLAPRDKPVSEYDDAEREAQIKHTLALRQQQREEQQRKEPEVSPERQHAEEISELLRPESKRAMNQALIESIYPSED